MFHVKQLIVVFEKGFTYELLDTTIYWVYIQRGNTERKALIYDMQKLRSRIARTHGMSKLYDMAGRNQTSDKIGQAKKSD